MTFLDMKISPSTVKRVLLEHGINPDPDKCKHIDWQEFIDAHKDIIAATDFMTAEVLEKNTLTRYHILFFIKVGSREVKLGGIKHDPYREWMMQIARNETDYADGFLKNSKYLIMDNDLIYTKKVVDIFKTGDVTVKKIAVRAPQMNAYIERFIQTIQKECLNKLILTSEEQLRYVVTEYLKFYNHERPHQGLDGKMILPHEKSQHAEIIKFSRLGGLLKSYRRVSVTEKLPDFIDNLSKRLSKVG